MTEPEQVLQNKMDDLCNNYMIRQHPTSYTVKIIDGKPKAIPDEYTEYLSPEEDDTNIRRQELVTLMHELINQTSKIRLHKGVGIDFNKDPIGFRWHKSKPCDELGNCNEFESKSILK